MVRGPDAYSERFLSDLSRNTERLNRAQRQLSSGRRINAASDSPGEVAHLVSLRADLSRTEQIHTNLGRIKTETDTAEQALSSSVTTLDRIQVLGAQGASTIVDAATRRTLAGEIGQLLERLVGLADTQVDGRYLFSGDSDQTRPYSIDLSQATPITAYRGTGSTREVAHPSGIRFDVGRTAQEIFDSPVAEENVFQSVNALRVALDANDFTAIGSALGNVRIAAKHLNDQLAYYGSIQGQVNDALNIASRRRLDLQTQISGIEDADLSAAAIELNIATFQQQASMQAEGRRPRQSLFDYLG